MTTGRGRRRRRTPAPTLFQLFAAVDDGSMDFRDAYRIARAQLRAAKRQRMTHYSKRAKP